MGKIQLFQGGHSGDGFQLRYGEAAAGEIQLLQADQGTEILEILKFIVMNGQFFQVGQETKVRKIRCLGGHREFRHFPQPVGHENFILSKVQLGTQGQFHGRIGENSFLNHAADGVGDNGQRTDQAVGGHIHCTDDGFAAGQGDGLGEGGLCGRGV